MSHWMAIQSGHPDGKKELICIGVTLATDGISNPTAQQQENEKKTAEQAVSYLKVVARGQLKN